jgi:hypothetical protein
MIHLRNVGRFVAAVAGTAAVAFLVRDVPTRDWLAAVLFHERELPGAILAGRNLPEQVALALHALQDRALVQNRHAGGRFHALLLS